MKLSTDHNALELQDGRSPTNPVEQAYQEVVRGNQAATDTQQYAMDIYEDDYKREVLEAFFLANATDADIQTILRIPSAVVKEYKAIFWDSSVFRDELDIETYAHSYTHSDYGKSIKISAVTLGLPYLRYRFSRGKHSEISLMDALQNMIETSFVLSQATRLNPLDSDASREARQWMAMVVKNIDQYIRTKPVLDNLNDEFEIALRHIDQKTKELPSIVIDKDDILH